MSIKHPAAWRSNIKQTITDAVLHVDEPELLWKRAAGLSVLERLIFTISRVQIKRLQINMPEPTTGALAALRLPPDLKIFWQTQEPPALPYISLSSKYFIRVEALRKIMSGHYAENTSFCDESSGPIARIVISNDATTSHRKIILAAGDFLYLHSPLGQDARHWLFLAGPKSQDGFMARHFDRHISLTVSRFLIDTSITPNMMTIFSSVLGLFGSALFLGSSRRWYVPGALLVWLHSVLDGCDGEMARLRFQESTFGSDLDFWGDNLVHLALFSCLGIGFWSTGNGVHTLVLAAVADAGVLASALTAWQHRRARRRIGIIGPEAGVTDETTGSGITAQLSRLENTLAQRDFIYLLVLLAFVDCVYEFLWAAAIGGLLYFAIMLYLRRVNQHENAQ